MAYAIIPWESQNIPDEIQEELNRRKVNRSFNYIETSKGEWDKQTGDWTKYQGPMSPWIRFCSNGNGTETPGMKYLNNLYGPDYKVYNKPGFIFGGGKDFYSGYGFNGLESGISTIGFMPDGLNTPHTIENDLKTTNNPIHVPAPEVENINITIQKELYRRATVDWVCFSKAQLEYMTPYFLVPGISCILEWGWNHYNPASLLDLSDINDLRDKFNNPYPLYTENILKSKGNYDVIIGIVTNFEWSIEGNKIKCKTEITSKDRIYAGILTESSVMDNRQNQSKLIVDKLPDPLGNLKQFINQEFDKFRSVNTIDDIKSDITEPNDVISEYNGIYKTQIEEEKARKRKALRESTKANPEEIANEEKLLEAERIRAAKHTQLYKDKKTSKFIKYVEEKHKYNWQEYVYGVYYGRGERSSLMTVYNNEDFDVKTKNKELWINLGLVIEAINYHIVELSNVNTKEMFRIDIDDVVIGGHPNLMSTDGSVCLIPNAEAPKYFYGPYEYYADPSREVESIRPEYDAKMNPSTFVIDKKPRADCVKNSELSEECKDVADWKVMQVCNPNGKILRDNIDELINEIRYSNLKAKIDKNPNEPDLVYNYRFSFPFMFKKDTLPDGSPIPKGSIPRPAHYSGYLKNIYVNLGLLKTLINEEGTNTYVKFIEKVLQKISSACGNFWDFRLVGGTGKQESDKKNIAAMKIVDYKFMSTINQGKVYIFDYYDADNLLLGLNFKPTISNAQAIRTIFSSTNNPNKRFTLTNGNNELLDYQFSDRIKDDDINGQVTTIERDTSGFKNIMRQLQKIAPLPTAYQVTCLSSNINTSAIVFKDNEKPILEYVVKPTVIPPNPYNRYIDSNAIQPLELLQVGSVKLGKLGKAGLSSPNQGIAFTAPILPPKVQEKKEIVRRLVLPEPEILQFLLDDGDEFNNPKYTGIMPGIQASFTLQGIGGLRTFMMFLVRNLPKPYSHEDIVFRIVDVQETIESGKWTTVITAGVIPLRPYIKKRLGIAVKTG